MERPVQTDRLIDKPERGFTSWVPFVYHKLDPTRSHACLTCQGDYTDATGLDHLMRTAYQPGHST